MVKGVTFLSENEVIEQCLALNECWIEGRVGGEADNR